jgi:hypothetical protein
MRRKPPTGPGFPLALWLSFVSLELVRLTPNLGGALSTALMILSLGSKPTASNRPLNMGESQVEIAAMRKTKRGQDLRNIRQSQCYTIQECSRVLAVGLATVRFWIRQGLPTLSDGKPILIPGDTLKSWLKGRRAARKQICQPNELYCCRCRGPRKAKIDSVVITPRNAKTVAIRALCGTCDATMNKGGSLARLPEIQAAFGLNTPAQVSLAECENPAVNHYLEKEPAE